MSIIVPIYNWVVKYENSPNKLLLYTYTSWWVKFKERCYRPASRSIGYDAYRDAELAKFSGKIIQNEKLETVIQFESEANFTLFLLKWG